MTAARKVPVPRTLERATELLAMHSHTAAKIAAFEADRRERIAGINASADAVVEPLIGELAGIEAAIEPWWKANAAALTKGKRKSIELGGCKIGTRSSADTLQIGVHPDDALASAVASKWRKQITRVTTSLDRKAIAKLLEGGTSAIATALKGMGFTMGGGSETFFIARIDSADAKVSAQ